jgi:hypothetical protein
MAHHSGSCTGNTQSTREVSPTMGARRSGSNGGCSVRLLVLVAVVITLVVVALPYISH